MHASSFPSYSDEVIQKAASTERELLAPGRTFQSLTKGCLMKIFGLTRFSVLASEGLRQTRDVPYEQRAAQIFSEERLHHRMRLFRAFVVPELRAMTRQSRDYRHLVFISPEMPLMWKLRLRQSLFGVRHKIVLVHKGENFVTKANRVVTSLSSGSDVFTFRIDDDDALPSGYLKSLLENIPTQPLYKGISWEEGYYIKKMTDDKYLVRQMSMPLIAIGLGLYSPRGAETKTIFCLGNHAKINEKVDALERLSSPRWIRTVHGTNDSMARLKEGEIYSSAETKTFLAREFPALDASKAMAAL
jgi:hypothetical protein